MNAPNLRRLSNGEHVVLKRLLDDDFQGVGALREQLGAIQVQSIDSEGSLKLQPEEGSPRAEVAQRVPVEAELKDHDGFMIHVLLHVIDGLMDELEIYKENLSAPQRDLDAKDLRVFASKEGPL
jgi:hypothetical protein